MVKKDKNMEQAINIYRGLLEKCLYAFNHIPKIKISGNVNCTTYDLIKNIEKAFKTIGVRHVEIPIPGINSVFLVIKPSTGMILAGELHEEYAKMVFKSWSPE